jgi:hypothetical protein
VTDTDACDTNEVGGRLMMYEPTAEGDQPMSAIMVNVHLVEFGRVAFEIAQTHGPLSEADTVARLVPTETSCVNAGLAISG